MAMEFTDQAIIVTGAGYGIGREIALAFGRLGGNVVLAARSREKLDAVAAELKALQTRPLAIPLDVAREAEVAAMVKQAHGAYGKIDVLVNNSGIGGPTALARDVTGDQWRETIDINLSGAFYCAKYVSERMIAAKRGNIVNISSVAGRIGFPLRTPYAASKWGLIGLSHSLAAELGPHGIRVNAVVPGPIEGERIKRQMRDRAQAEGKSYEELMRGQVAGIPLGRMATEAEVANAVVYLASSASAGITGQALNVDGGVRMQ
jgi:NAD(P)-dependent dehydrogenase (short-subunit alcohol dehydrogenase family)